MKNLIDKLLNIVQYILGYGIFVGLFWLVSYIFANTLLGDIAWWIIGSWLLGAIILAMITLIGESYIWYKGKLKANKEWPFDTGDKNWNDLVSNVFVILFGSLIIYLLDYL